MINPNLYIILIGLALLIDLPPSFAQTNIIPSGSKHPNIRRAQSSTKPISEKQSPILGDGSTGCLYFVPYRFEAKPGEVVDFLLNNTYHGVAPIYKGKIEITYPPVVEFFATTHPDQAIAETGKVTWSFEIEAPILDWEIEMSFRLPPEIGDTISGIAFTVRIFPDVPDSAGVGVPAPRVIRIIQPESIPIGATKGIKWLRTIGFPSSFKKSESQWAGIYGLDTSADGNYLFASGIIENDTNYFNYLAKYTLDGLSIWERYNEKSAYSSANISSIYHTAKGGVVEISDTIAIRNSYSTSIGILVKQFDRDGRLEWRKFISTTNDLIIGLNSVTVLDDSNILVAFATDTKTGELSNNLPDSTGVNIVVMKLSSIGQTLWYKVFGGDGYDIPTGIKALNNGDILLTGTTTSVYGDINGFKGNADYDNASNAFVIKLKADGQLLWSKTFSLINSDNLLSVVETSKGYLLAGYSEISEERRIDSLKNGVVIWLLELDTQGQPVSQRVYPVYPGYEGFESAAGVIGISADGQGNFYLGGYSGDKYGPLKSKHGSTDIVLAKINSEGEIIWQRAIGGTREEFLYSMIVNRKGDVFFGGLTNSNNDDVNAYKNPANYRMLIGKMGVTNTISGKVYDDKNGNKQQDTGEAFINEGKVLIIKGSDSIYARIFNGHYLANIDTGSYTVIYKGNDIYYTTNPAKQTVNFQAIDQEANIDIPLKVAPGIYDLQVSLSTTTPARPGFEAAYTIITKNVGTEPVSGYVLKFAKPATTQFMSASRSVSSNTPDSLKFSSKNLAVGFGDTVWLSLKLANPPTINNGDTLAFTAIATPLVTDTTPLNNIATLRQVTRGSYDPNDKSEAHAGVYTPTMKGNNEPFQYLIRFQNTGTDTAFYVTVKDTLSEQVDLNSLEVISTSHPYTFSLDGNIATWQFDMIKLVDSTTNEPKSHGYISFSIKPKEELQVGDTVGNTAAIYFDFNLPVITNVSELLMVSDQSVICPGSSTQLLAGYTGIAYQWQVNTGSGFTNISNSTQYGGISTNALLLKSVPSSFYNYQYRCLITLSGGKTVYSNTYKLTFANSWTGTISNAWENAANWSCGSVPDANTDVIIKSTAIRQPQVNTTTATCRSINANQGSHVWIKVGAKLDVKGK